MSDNYVMQIITPKTGFDPDDYKNSDNSYTFEYDIALTVPMPYCDGFNGIISTLVDGGRNANGDFEGSVIGQPKRKIDGFQWKGKTPTEIRPLMQYFKPPETFVFYARYFDALDGTFAIRKFYRGDISWKGGIYNSVTNDFETFEYVKMNVIEV